MKHTATTTAVFLMLAAGFAAACVSEWSQDEDNWNTGFWNTYLEPAGNGSIAFYSNATDDYLRICINQSFQGGRDKAGIIGDPYLFSVPNDAFDITFNWSHTSGTVAQFYEMIGLMDSSLATDYPAVNATKGLYYQSNFGSAVIFCNGVSVEEFNNALGFRTLNLVKYNSSDVVHYIFNHSGVENNAGTCDFGSVKSDVYLPFAKVESWSTSNNPYPCMDIRSIDSQSNIDFLGSFQVMRSDGTIPGEICNVTHIQVIN